MPLFTVDTEKCTQDGLCRMECPAGLVEMDPESGFPRPIPEAEKYCISCGHCVAVCPVGALSHRDMSPQDCPEVQTQWQLSPERVEHFLRSRRSIRSYKEKNVEQEVLERLIRVASFAPSGHNRQPVRWLVIHSRESVLELAAKVVDWMRYMINEGHPLAQDMQLSRVVAAWEAGYDPICRTAPHVVVAHGEQKDPTVPAACTIALSYLELAAPSFGLGACWGGFFSAAAQYWPEMQKALDLPQGHACFGAMLLGYPAVKYQRLPLRRSPQITWRE
ncbi:MAG: nitroreductase family protein [Desulfohalobiaceae bacterium]